MKHLSKTLLLATGIVAASSMLAAVDAQAQSPGGPAASGAGVKQPSTRAQQLMGDIAPKMAELTDGTSPPGLGVHRASWVTSTQWSGW